MALNYQMASANNPQEIIEATQHGLVDAMRSVIKSMKTESALSKQPGLTWEQIDYMLVQFRDKKPHVVIQEEPV